MSKYQNAYPLSERLTESYAKDAWVNAWLEGNRLIPQYSIGINVFVLSAILEGEIPDQILHGDFEFRLSSEQLRRAKDMMNGAHRLNSIPAATADYRERLSQLTNSCIKIISDIDLENVWNFGLLEINNFLNFLKQNDYFNHEALDDVRRIILKIRAIFDMPKIKVMLKAYKTSLCETDLRDRDNPYLEAIIAFILMVLNQEDLELRAIPKERLNEIVYEALGLSVKVM